MAKRGSSSERVKRLLLTGLGVALAGVVVYQVLNSGPAPRGPRNVNSSANRPQTSSGQTSPVKQGTANQEKPATGQAAALQELLADQSPLDLSAFSGAVAEPQSGSRGSIFAYYVPPPIQPKPKPPAPIKIEGIQPQTAVAGTPRRIMLTVRAGSMPDDAAIFFDGRPRASKRAGENELTTEIQPSEYTSQRTINVEVRSTSDPNKMYSDPRQFIVQAAPEPPFRYIARLGNLSQPDTSYGVFELTATREIKRMKRGEVVASVWRIDSVNADSVDLTHTQLEIKRRMPLQEKPVR
jgi:hypothetical protein